MFPFATNCFLSGTRKFGCSLIDFKKIIIIVTSGVARKFDFCELKNPCSILNRIIVVKTGKF